MTVAIEAGVIFLRGRCLAEDAEALLVALQNDPAMIVDITEVQRLHAAVLQVLLAAAPVLRGVPVDPFLREMVFAKVEGG